MSEPWSISWYATPAGNEPARHDLAALPEEDRARIQQKVADRARRGDFSTPTVKALKGHGGLAEFRIICADRVSYRVVFGKDDARHSLVMLAVFRKSRANERRMVEVAAKRWRSYLAEAT